jgi:hypothetical protein
LFREQPTAELARSARLYVQNAVSENERLQFGLHPWTSFLIVPIFALANAGVHLSGPLLSDSLSSPVTIGIVCALVLGKLFGIGLTTLVAAHPRMGRLPLPVQLPPVFGAAALCGIGFTLSLFIAGIAFDGRTLQEAKVGILAAAVISTLLGAAIIAVTTRMAARELRDSIGAARRPRGSGGPRARSHPRPSRRPRDAARIRRLRVHLLRPGRGHDPRAARSF